MAISTLNEESWVEINDEVEMDLCELSQLLTANLESGIAKERARVLALFNDWAKSIPADEDDYEFIIRGLRAAIESGEEAQPI